MSPADLVLFEEDFRALHQVLRRLRHESAASVVLLVDKNGQRIASVGDVEALDMTALASLTAGNVAATDHAPSYGLHAFTFGWCARSRGRWPR